MDAYGLNDSQVETLRQFQEIASTEDTDMAICTLASLDWNLERAIETHLGGGEEDNDIVHVEPEVQFVRAVDHNPIEPRVQPARQARPNRPLIDTIQVNDDDDVDYTPLVAANPSLFADGHFAVPRPPRQMNGRNGVAEDARSAASSSAFLSGSRNAAGGNERPASVAGSTAADSDNDMVMSDDDYAIGHDDVDVMNEVSNKNAIPLIPTDSTSIEESLHNFVVVFEARFASQPGCLMPNFFTGSLMEAVREAFEAPGRGIEERRPLALYIHNDKSIAANIFPSMVLCKDEIVTLLRCQYVLWPWDVTHRENEKKLHEWLDLLNLSDARHSIDVLSRQPEKFPLLVVLTREKGSYNVVTLCSGMDTVPTVVQKLMSGVDAYTDIRMTESMEQRDREERERIRQEQAMEYEMSLAADKARIEAKEREAREQREEEERRRQAEEDEQINRAQLASELPDEPADGAPGVIMVKFRLPEGEQCMRRFRNTETLAVLLKFLAAKGYAKEQFRFFNSDFPKKDVSQWNVNSSFVDLKWPIREQIFVEEN